MNADRVALLEGGGHAPVDEFDESDSLTRGSKHIANSRRNIAETTDKAAAILEDLAKQRGVINRAKETVMNIDGNIGQSSSIIGQMNRRAQVNKLAIYGVFAVIAISILAVLYYRLRH